MNQHTFISMLFLSKVVKNTAEEIKWESIGFLLREKKYTQIQISPDRVYRSKAENITCTQ